MADNNVIIVCLLMISHTISVVAGFMICYIVTSTGTNFASYESKLKKSKTNSKNVPQTHIDIDDTKVVLKIDTTNLEKKFDNIAEAKKQKNDISGSVNKLKQLKGK